MIKDNQNFNESIKPNSDFLTELKEKLPEFFNGESEFDLPKFKSLLKENNIYDELTSGNQLNFIGKEYARKQGGERPTSVVVPDIEHNKSSENENSQNIFFTGDNLEVLRHMQNYYQNSIDMIYIDPPYNTGNDDFIYPDNFEYSDEKLQSMFGLNDNELKRLKSIQGKATHSAWLTFMYPRLYLAKKLLKPEGVIFVSIDDNEQANLKLLMDEIFGEGSFVASICHKHRSGVSNDKIISENHNFLLFYVKNIVITEKRRKEFGIDRKKEDFKNYNKNDDDGKGNYTLNPVTGPGGARKGNPFYEFLGVENYWRFSEEKMKSMHEEGRIIKINNTLYQKTYVSDMKGKRKGGTTWWDKAGTTSNGTNQLKNLFGEALFDFPKPTKLILEIMKFIKLNKSATVFDFFAGSSTTADAVLQLNAEDGGNRRFIMATLAEPTYNINKNGDKIPTKGGKNAFEAGYMNIAELSRERIRRASAKIQKDTLLDLFDNFDGGFKHYMVVEPNEPALDLIDDFKSVKESLFDNMINPFSSDSLGVGGSASGVDTILTTWLLADGYSLDAKTEKKDFASYSADFVEDTRLYLIKGDGWGAEQTRELLNQIGKNQFSLQTIVYYKYHFDMETVNELQLGLSQLDKNIKLLGRF